MTITLSATVGTWVLPSVARRFGPCVTRGFQQGRHEQQPLDCEADPYLAPKGTFGNITLTDRETVFDSGVRDRSYQLALGYDLTPAQLSCSG